MVDTELPVYPSNWPDRGLISQVTPFSYIDGQTYQSILFTLTKYIKDDLVPSLQAALDSQVEYVDLALVAALADVAARITESENSTDAKIADLTEYVNTSVAQIINDSIQVQDPVISGIMLDPNSETRQAMNAVFADKVTTEDSITVINDILAGRLSVESLNSAYSAKELTEPGGRLGETEIDARFAEKADESDIESIQNVIGSLPDNYAAKFVEEIVTTGRLAPDKFGSMIQGEGERQYRMVAGAIRNDGPGWNFINDSAHRPTNGVSVSQDSSKITIDYSAIGATKVVSFVVVPDETLAGVFDFGCSVGLANTNVTIKRREMLSDYINYNGSAWISQLGKMVVESFNAGVIRVSHADIFDPTLGSDPLAVTVTGRDGATAGARYQVASTGVSETWVDVVVRDNSGTLLAVPSANVRFFVSRGLHTVVADPGEITTAPGNYPGSNIWFIGLFEV